MDPGADHSVRTVQVHMLILYQKKLTFLPLSQIYRK